MADLISIFGGAYTPSKQERIDPPEVQLIDAMLNAGIETPPEHIDFDGRLHRFKNGKKEKTGWYIAFDGDYPAGAFGCWRADIDSHWVAEMGRKPSPAEESARALRVAEARAFRDAELKKMRETVSDIAEAIYSSAPDADASHAYLTAKGIGPNGIKQTQDSRLIVPLYNKAGEIISLQYISAKGEKLFHTGGQTEGGFYVMGDLDKAGAVYIAEGFATAATIHEVTGQPTFAAFSAYNMPSVAMAARELAGNFRELVVVGDNDNSGVGQKYAKQAGEEAGARVVIPPATGDANDYKQAGNDLMELLTPPRQSSDWLIPADEFCQKPAPIQWLVKNWVQDKALIMVHGQSGGGKTFVVLDWCLRMASGLSDWCGHKVKSGGVVYLAGEGHHGLKGRIAAWKHKHDAGSLKMWLSKDGCDLNTAQGYMRVIEQVKSLPEPPRLIVVDTLHRFLQGDENSAQDAKTMLDACNGLMQEFDCSVILVHHTGVSGDAQHRARGSSAWRGALDIEISITPASENAPIEVSQKKSKDAELAQPVYLQLETVEIPGWFDEDGNPVTSAVAAKAEAPESPQKNESKPIQKDLSKFTKAWWHSGAEDRKQKPYLSRSALIDYLMESEGLTDSSARTYVKEGKKGRLISNLIDAELIIPHEHGWIICDPATAACLILSRGNV